MAMGNLRGVSKCNLCGKPIRFVVCKKDKKKIAVEAAAACFLPPNGFSREEWFIDANGDDVIGCRVRDGRTGYKRHECQ